MLSYWPGLLINSLLGFLIFTYAVFGETGEWPQYQYRINDLLITILLLNLAGFAIWWANRKLDNFLSWKNLMERRFLLSMVLNPLIAGLCIFGSLTLWFWMTKGWEEVDYLANEYQNGIIRISVVLFFLTFIFSLVDFTFFTYRFLVSERIKKMQVSREQKAAQYDLLRSQLSPHYLFNCLNTINSLSHKDPVLAESFIRKFAGSFQYILNTHKRKLVRLKEEINFVKDYIFMLQIRFESNLECKWNIAEEYVNQPIPPLTLQLLVENAVKHNAISSDEKLSIEITHTDEGLIVKNNRTRTPANPESFGVGLENIRQRYAFFSNEKIKVSDSQFFSVQLPQLPTSLFS